MIFKSLTLSNIRSYKNNEPIDFPVGTSLFEGDIGSGKSTILMAIEFALFGLGNQKGDSLLRKGSKKGSVTLEFGVGEDNYLVQRSLIRKENEGPVRQEKGLLGINGAKIELSPSEIKEKILKILNFKEPLNPRAQSVIFRYAVYTPQEEMKYILSQKPVSYTHLDVYKRQSHGTSCSSSKSKRSIAPFEIPLTCFLTSTSLFTPLPWQLSQTL